jgi:hypothetical protein
LQDVVLVAKGRERARVEPGLANSHDIPLFPVAKSREEARVLSAFPSQHC